MNKLTLLSATILCAASAMAQDAGMLLDLRERDQFNRCTQTSLTYDHDEYSPWTFNNFKNCPQLYNYQITEPYYSDYLISPLLQLEQGVLYRITLAPSPYNQAKTGKVSIGYGQGENLEAYTRITTFDQIPYASDTEAEVRTVDFNVPASGEYKIYFLGEGNALSLYNTTIERLGVSDTPGAVTLLTALPADDGSASATVMFTLPTQTRSGAPLDGQLNYKIYRNNDQTHVKAGRGMAGENVVWTDNNAPLGYVTYAVEVISGSDTGDRTSVSTYVGPETPLPPSGVTVNSSNNSFSVSWTAPAKGTHDADINPSLLTYKVTRILDGERTVVTASTYATSVDDQLAVSGSHQLQYEVVAILGENNSEAALSTILNVGSAALPFADSFAGAVINDKWTTEVLNGTVNWTAVAAATTQQPLCEPVDGDGGMAFYCSWNAQRGHSARLATIPLSKASSINPVVEFYLCHHTNSNNDVVKLQISIDGGEWTDIPDAEVSVKGSVAGQWEKYTFPISSVLPEGCTSYRIGFTAVSAYGHNTYIDNVRIFNVYERDLAITVKTPETVTAGSDMTLQITLANNGANEATPADYSIAVDTDYPGEIPAIVCENIPSLQSRTYEVTLPVTAFEAKDMDLFHFTASVDYTNDNDASNNSATATTAPLFVEHPAPATLTAERQADNSVLLSWDAVGESRQPVNVVESFEDCPVGQTGQFNSFVSLDLDEQDGGTYYNTSGSTFKVVEKPAVVTGQDGAHIIGLTLGASKQQDDWIISPALDCAPGSQMTLKFLLAAKKFSSYGYDYTYEVRYATGDYDPEAPMDAFNTVVKTVTSSNYGAVFKADETFWEQNIEGIPADAKYVAIHFKTKMSLASAIWVDNIRITEQVPFALLGYNVYSCEAGRLNDTPLDGATTQFVVNSVPSRSAAENYFVTAMYTDGESAPGQMATVETSVAETSCATSIIGTHGALVVNVPDGTMLRIYDTRGLLLLEKRAAGYERIALPAGIYVVRADDTAVKAVVR